MLRQLLGGAAAVLGVTLFVLFVLSLFGLELPFEQAGTVSLILAAIFGGAALYLLSPPGTVQITGDTEGHA